MFVGSSLDRPGTQGLAVQRGTQGLLGGGLGSCTALCQVALAICHLAAGLDRKFSWFVAPSFLYFCVRIRQKRVFAALKFALFCVEHFALESVRANITYLQANIGYEKGKRFCFAAIKFAKGCKYLPPTRQTIVTLHADPHDHHPKKNLPISHIGVIIWYHLVIIFSKSCFCILSYRVKNLLLTLIYEVVF